MSATDVFKMVDPNELNEAKRAEFWSYFAYLAYPTAPLPPKETTIGTMSNYVDRDDVIYLHVVRSAISSWYYKRS